MPGWNQLLAGVTRTLAPGMKKAEKAAAEAAAKAVSKAASTDIAKEAAKEAAPVAAKTAAKTGSKEGAKIAADVVKHTITESAGIVKSGSESILKNWKGALGLGLGGTAFAAVGVPTFEAMKKHGILGGAQEAVFGEGSSDKNVLKNASSAVLGKETTEKVNEVISDGGDMIAGLFKQPDGQQGYNPPMNYADYQQELAMNYNSQILTQQQALLGQGGVSPQMFPAQYVPQQSGNTGLFSSTGMFSGVGNAASSFLDGGTAMSIAALIPAAFLMFGRFGWLGKIASLFLGSLSLKNMRNQQVLNPAQGASLAPSYVPQVGLGAINTGQSMAEQYGLDQDDNNPLRQVRI